MKRVLVSLVLALVASPAFATTYNAHNSSDLSTYITAAMGGDTILLDAGTTYTGHFTLAAKGSSSDITITTSGCQAAVGERLITPADDALLATITNSGSGDQNIRIPASASPTSGHWVIDCVKLVKPDTSLAYGMIRCGNSDTGADQQDDVSKIPSHVTVKRVWFHLDATQPEVHGILSHCDYFRAEYNYFENLKHDTESHCISGYNFQGHWVVNANYCESAGIGTLIGGTNPMIVGIQPTDLVWTNNTFVKRLEWLGDPAWNEKNCIEFKTGTYVTIDKNSCDQSWDKGQNGECILLTPKANLQTVAHVSVTNNVCLHVCTAMQIAGEYTPDSTGRTDDVTVSNNLFIGNGPSCSISGKIGFDISNGPTNVTFTHNTVDNLGNLMGMDGTTWTHPLTFTYNIINYGTYGPKADGQDSGTDSLNAFWGSGQWTWANNVICGYEGASGAQLPNSGTNTYVQHATTCQAQFVDYASYDLRLIPGSPYTGAGVDFSLLPGGSTSNPSNGRLRFRFKAQE